MNNDILPVYIFKPDEDLETLAPDDDCSATNQKLCLLEKLAIEMDLLEDEEMNKLGPVIIVPEPEFTKSDVDDIANQINIIHEKCDKCMIAVIPDQTVTPDNVDASGTLIAPPNSALHELSKRPAFDHVDMIGLHFFLNDYSDKCRSDEAVYRLINYTKQTLALYQKPSIILYYGAANDNSICTSEEAS
ncbi:unnamed protein product, partial [marine sediment metagenome]